MEKLILSYGEQLLSLIYIADRLGRSVAYKELVDDCINNNKPFDVGLMLHVEREAMECKQWVINKNKIKQGNQIMQNELRVIIIKNRETKGD